MRWMIPMLVLTGFLASGNQGWADELVLQAVVLGTTATAAQPPETRPPAEAQPPEAPPEAQPPAPQPGDRDFDIDIDIREGQSQAWYLSPVWLAIGGLAAILLIVLIAMAFRGGGTTIVKE